MNLLTPTGWKDIADVNPGDELVAYDVNTGQQIINQLLSKQLVTVADEESTFYRINHRWTLYANQSVWVDGRVDHAFNLKLGDVVYDWQDSDVTVTSVEALSGTEWWRLEVSGDHSYIANELTLHNASRYWVGGGSSANWNATANTNWGSSSGVQNNSSVPTSADDVIFDGAGVGGNTNSTISATITILSLNVGSSYTGTTTVNAQLSITNTLTIGNSGASFIGTSGWTCTTLTNASTSAATITLKDGNTYTVTGALTAFQSRSGSQVLFTSSHASNRAILTLRNPSTCNCLASFTRIDASAGRTITTFNGTITDCLNVISYNDLRPVAT